MHNFVVFYEYLFYNCIMKFCLVVNNTKPLAQEFAKSFIEELKKKCVIYREENNHGIESHIRYRKLSPGESTQR